MPSYAIMVDHDYCTGCHACEVACKQEYHRPAGRMGGIKVIEMVDELPGGKWDVTYFPVLTRLCIFCLPRLKKGGLPACVKHCMAGCMTFGTVEELTRQAPKGRKSVLWTQGEMTGPFPSPDPS